MSSNNFFKSSLPGIHHVVQNTMISAPKEIVIASLKDYFSQDHYYRYGTDPFGFANTTDHTDLPLDAGYNDNLTTRLYIGENWRKDGIFYPAILVKHGGGRSVPISMNREEGTVDWEITPYEDGYGNITFYRKPKSFIFAGAWEGSIIIDIMARNAPQARDDLLQEVMLCLTDITYKSLEKAGVAIKPGGNPSWSGTSEQDDRNDKLFRQTITLEIRSEWRREIPVSNVVEVINFSIQFGRVDDLNAPVAQNLTIDTSVSMLDIMAGEIVPFKV